MRCRAGSRAAGYTFPKDLQDRLNRDGITARDLAGKVRS